MKWPFVCVCTRRFDDDLLGFDVDATRIYAAVKNSTAGYIRVCASIICG